MADSGMMPDPESGDNDDEIEVPLSSISIDGTPPAVGDTCDFAVEAKVVSIDGDNATVTPTKVNGQAVEDTDDDEQGQGADEGAPQFSPNGEYQQP